MIPPARRPEDTKPLPRPPFGADTGPERAPQPLPRRYEDVKKSVTSPASVTPRSQTTREQNTERREMQPAPALPSLRRPAARQRRACRPRASVPRPRRPAAKSGRTRKSGHCRGSLPTRPTGGVTAKTGMRAKRMAAWEAGDGRVSPCGGGAAGCPARPSGGRLRFPHSGAPDRPARQAASRFSRRDEHSAPAVRG